MITPVQCGTCNPQSLNLSKPQGPQATSFKGAERIIGEVGAEMGEQAPKFFASLFSKLKNIPSKIAGFFTTEGKGFHKLLDNAKGLIDKVLSFLPKKAPKA